MLSKRTSFDKLACAAVIAGSFVAAGHLAHGQDGVKFSFSDQAMEQKRELPKVDEKTVFRRLVQGFIPQRRASEAELNAGSKTLTDDQRPESHTSSHEVAAAVGSSAAGASSVAPAAASVPVASRSFAAMGVQAGQAGTDLTIAGNIRAATVNSQTGLVEAELSAPADQGRIEILPPAVSASRYQAPKGIKPLTGQGELFGSLWGKGDEREAESRFLRQQQTFPLGPAVRTYLGESSDDRIAAPASYTWAAPALYHKPLYFEQVNLERYGQGLHPVLQPVFSASHFFTNIAKLPYHVGATPPCENVYVLGHYRPGNRAPYQGHKPRPSWRGLIYQGVASGGLGVLIAP